MRKPDKIIGDGYLDRWHLIPRNKWCNIYLHRFRASDDDRALHDHPWWSVSFKLKGVLSEVFRDKNHILTKRSIVLLWPYVRQAQHTHRMVLRSKTAWTLFITGRKTREWGFEYPVVHDWMHHDEFDALHGD